MTAAAAAARPIADAELPALFGALRPYRTLLVAVSGGADSLALMQLLSRWRALREDAPQLLVATVDHGLRAESAAEAVAVGAAAARLGLAHDILPWLGPKPATGIQDAARAARYGLLAALARRAPAPAAIVTAHHQDDQAETLLMRLARGSGIDGLTGMRVDEAAPVAGATVPILRPLLGQPKSRLIATLRAAGESWIEDPGNATLDFERVRLRAAAATLAAAGLTAAQIARSARRIGRGRAALEAVTERLIDRLVDAHGGAYGAIARAGFDAREEEFQVRILQRVLAAFGGNGAPPRLARIEALLDRLATAPAATATLGGCLIVCNAQSIQVFREPGRAGLPIVPVSPGAELDWDRRFYVRVPVGCTGSDLTLGALGRPETALRDAGPGWLLALPAAAAATLPALWSGPRLLGLPRLARPGGAPAAAAAAGWIVFEAAFAGVGDRARRAGAAGATDV